MRTLHVQEKDYILHLLGSNVRNLVLYAKWVPANIMVAEVGGQQYATLQEAVDAVPTTNTPTTVILLRDIEVDTSITVAANQNIVFNFQNYKISNVSGTNNPIITNSGTIAISNGTIETTATQGAINNENGGRITISGGRIIAKGTKQALYNNAGGIAEITGTAYLSTTSNQRAAVQNVNGGTLTITGGTIISTRFLGVENWGIMTIGTHDGNININSPVIQGYTDGIGNTNANVNPEFYFYDGVVKYKNDFYNSNKIALSGTETGYGFIELTENINGESYYKTYLSNDKAVLFNPDGGTVGETSRAVTPNTAIGTLPVPIKQGYRFVGWFTDQNVEVTANTIINNDIELTAHWVKVYIAEANGNYYDSVNDAIAAATDNVLTTVTVLYNTSEIITVAKNKKIQLDIQSYTISNKDNSAVITNNGTIEIISGNITSTSINTAVINNNNGGKLTISGGTISATGERQAVYNNAGGTVEITGTANLSSSAPERATVQNLAKGTVNITGGTIISIQQQAVKNEGTMSIGRKDGTVSITTPVLQGTTYGATTTSTFKFYDGIIRGVTGTISGSISDVETGYQKTESMETIDGITYHKAILTAQ